MYWYDEAGKRYLTPEEQIKQAQQQAKLAEQRAQELAEQLRALGINPDHLDK